MKSESVENPTIDTEEGNSFKDTNHQIHQMALHERPSLYLLHEDELLLSRRAIVDLMSAVLEKGKAFRFRARGWSMSPFIRDGDSICISPVQGKPLAIGEIVAFDRPESGGLVVHRVIGRSENSWMIQGDNTPDQKIDLVPDDCILGRIVSVHRNGKHVWSGNGPERTLIAWLSRVNLLGKILWYVRNLRKNFMDFHSLFRGES